MQFAEFYHDSTGWNGKDFTGPVKLIPACGSDAVFVMDGRYGTERQASVARDVCRKRGFKGFTLNAGESFTRSRETRKLEKVH